MIKSAFQKSENGKLVLKEELSEEIVKKLKPLAKSIKKNKGLVTTWKAAIVLILAAVIILFNIIFKNKLIEAAAEKGLEAVFQAEVNIEDARLSILQGQFKYNSMTIADADKSMYNLMETGPAVIDISMGELLSKRVQIEQVSLEGVSWNTERDSDGSLVEEESTESKSEKSEESSALDLLALNPDDFDYQSIFDSQKDNLQSLRLLEDSNREIEEIRSRWSGTLDDKEREISSLKEKVNSVKSIDLKGISSVEEAQSAVGEVQAFYPEVEKMGQSVSGLNSEIQFEKDKVLSLGDSLTGSIETDLSYLGSTLNLSSGNLKSIASDLAEDYIRSRWNDYYEYGLKGWNIFKRFQNREKKEKEDKGALSRAEGRTILFPSKNAPQFHIKQINLSGGDDSVGNLTMEIKSITNEPDKIADPMEFELLLSQNASAIEIEGRLDLRDESDTLFDMSLSLPGLPVSMEDGIPTLSINSLTAGAAIKGIASSQRDSGIVITKLDVFMKEIVIEQSADNFLSRTVSGIFENSGDIQLEGIIAMSSSGIDSITVETSLDDLISDGVGDYLAELEDNVMGDLENNLLAYIGPQLEQNQILSSSMDALGIQSIEQINSVNSLEKILDDKVSEVENRAEAIVAEVSAQAESAVKEEAENILDKAKDSIKIPGF